MINDFELVTNSAGRNEILAIIKVLRDRGLIDGFGTQSHYFNVDGISAASLLGALNSMATAGVPIYVTELDLKGKTVSEAGQLSSYQTSFPVYWNHPAVAGITLWGYVEGATWASGTGILNSNGTLRSSMTWLKSYMASLPDVGYPFFNNIQIEDTLENILINGEFDNSTDPWQIDNYNGGSGSISLVKGENMSGDNALKICISAPGTERWHIQVSQAAPFVADKNYEITFMAKADAEANIALTMQMAGDPYTQYLEEVINLTTTNQSFSFPFIPSVSDASNLLKFFVGLNSTCIYIDSVVFKEVEIDGIEHAEHIQNISVYPNPVIAGKVTIRNTSGNDVGSVEILDTNGRLLEIAEADREVNVIDVSSLQKGIYILRIHAKNEVYSRRIVIL